MSIELLHNCGYRCRDDIHVFLPAIEIGIRVRRALSPCSAVRPVGGHSASRIKSVIITRKRVVYEHIFLHLGKLSTMLASVHCSPCHD